MLDAVADAVTDYLNGEDHVVHRRWAVASQPLPREFPVRLSRWWKLVTSIERMEEQRRIHARAALKDLAKAGVVGRTLLADWAAAVAEEPSARNLVRLWIAVRVWGGLGRFGVRNVWRGLVDVRLVDTLRMSALAILADPQQLEAICRDFQVQGTRNSFASKWFWAVSLASDESSYRPLILDKRVGDSLRVIAAHCGATWSTRADCPGYAKYVELLHDVASLVEARGHPHVDAEKVEWLLFDRRPRHRNGRRYHSWTQEYCLVDWLQKRHGRAHS